MTNRPSQQIQKHGTHRLSEHECLENLEVDEIVGSVVDSTTVEFGSHGMQFLRDLPRERHAGDRPRERKSDEFESRTPGF